MFEIRRLLIAVCVLGLLAGGHMAVAQNEEDETGSPPMQGMGPMMGPMMDEEAPPPPPQERPMMKLRALNRALQEVKLTDQQTQQIEEIRKEHRQQMEQWRKEHEPELTDLKQKMEQARKEQQPQMERGHAMWRKVRQLLESDVKGTELEQQVTQLRQEYRQLQQDREQTKKQMEPLHEQMQKLMATAPPAQPVVDKILNVLTAEQRPVVEKRMQEIEEQRPPMMGGPGPMRDQGGWDKGKKDDGERPHGRGNHGGPDGRE